MVIEILRIFQNPVRRSIRAVPCPGQKRKHYEKNVNGVSRDHLYSISEGLNNNINPLLLSHPANCRIMIHLNNKQKHSQCSITIEELKIKILEWEEKYNTFPKVKKLVEDNKLYLEK